MSNSTPNSTPRKRLPRKPKNFPLSIHKGTGYWTKEVRGKAYCFGTIEVDPNGKEAFQEWLRVRDDLLAGRDPDAPDPNKLTVRELVNRYLEHPENRRDTGEVTPRTWHGLYSTCEKILRVLGKTRKAVSLRNEMQRVRSVFKFAYDNGFVEAPVRFGTEFDKPKVKQVRKEKR